MDDSYFDRIQSEKKDKFSYPHSKNNHMI